MWVGRKAFVKLYLTIIMKRGKEKEETINTQSSAAEGVSTFLPASFLLLNILCSAWHSERSFFFLLHQIYFLLW